MRAPRYAAGSPIGCALVHSPVDEALVIAGGGPAGTAAALTLARAGQSPLVIERGEAADEKLCCCFLSSQTEAKLARLGVKADRPWASPKDRVRQAAESSRA